MSDKPIIFNSESIRGILDGRKTQTRWAIKLKDSKDDCCWCYGEGFEYIECGNEYSGYDYRMPCRCRMPHSCYRVGDRLWVRETYWDKGYWETDKDYKRHWVLYRPEEKIDFYYDADGKPDEIRGSYTPFGSCMYLRKHPSIHMKKKDARIWLDVTGVRFERDEADGDWYRVIEFKKGTGK